MTILCYHSVEPDWPSPLAVSPDSFSRHVAWLARHRRVLPLEAAVADLDASARLPRGLAAITFDDGFAGLYEHALPILSSLRIPSTVFLVAGTLADPPTPTSWISPPPSHPVSTLNRGEVLEMQERGVSFGSHSYRHADLTGLSEEDCTRDLRDSRRLLEDLLRCRVTFLAYPYGRNNEPVRRAAERAGFTHAFGLPSVGGPIGRFSIPRVGIYPGNGRPALRIKLSRWYVPVRTSPLYPMLRRIALKGAIPG